LFKGSAGLGFTICAEHANAKVKPDTHDPQTVYFAIGIKWNLPVKLRWKPLLRGEKFTSVFGIAQAKLKKDLEHRISAKVFFEPCPGNAVRNESG
jgi:hypothetical protein